MPLETNGNIKFDGKDYTLSAKALGLEKIDGNGDLDEMIGKLKSQIANAVQEEFKVPPESVTMTAYSMNLTFTVEGPTNRQLTEFFKEMKD
jgi:hypothetical protein